MKYLKSFLVFVLTLVAVVTLTGCSSNTVIPGLNPPGTNTPDSSLPETPNSDNKPSETPNLDNKPSEPTISETMLSQFEKFNNDVMQDVYTKEYSLMNEKFHSTSYNNILVEEADNWQIYDFNSCEKQLVKGKFTDIWNYKGIRQRDSQNKVTLYDGISKMTEKMNIKGFVGKAEEVYNFNGGTFEQNNKFYEFDCINQVKQEYMLSNRSSSYNTTNNNNWITKYYVDNNGSLFTVVKYDEFMNIKYISQSNFADNKLTQITYAYSESPQPSYIKSIGAYFDWYGYRLDVKTTSYKAGNLTAPNIDSYEFGGISTPQFWG